MNEPIQYVTSLVVSGEKDQSFLENCINFFPALVYIMDQRGEILSVNNKLTDYLGFTTADLEAQPSDLEYLVINEDRHIVETALARFRQLQVDEEYTYVARFNHKNGGNRYLKTTGRTLRSNTDNSLRVFCIGQDITEIIRIEEESETTRQLFDETENLILFGTWSWTPSSDVLEWTSGMYNLLEYGKEELPVVSNEFFMKHISAEHVEPVKQAVDRTVADGSPFDIEFVIRTRSGKEKFVHTKGKSILDKNGNVRRIIGITRDVTSKKNFEKERERYIRELNRSNKELEEFAYVASHDMHEPLRKILTFSERLKAKCSESLGEDGKVYLERIAASAGNMRSLIDNLLEFSRVSRGARSFEKCDLNKVVADVLADQELRIEETSTKVIVGDLPNVEAVATELRQLFNNLISNALKFRKKEVAPEIRITATKLTQKEKSDLFVPFNQTYHRIDVTDNGIGFESVYAERIFEIFQRLHGKSEYSGSGIGLAICKKIVANHGGLIRAASNVGSGSTFSVFLPEKQSH